MRGLRALVRRLRRVMPTLALRNFRSESLVLPTCLPHEAALPTRCLSAMPRPGCSNGAASLWPLNSEAFLAQGAAEVVERLDLAAATTSEPARLSATPLFENERPWSNSGMLVLWLGMAGRDGDLRGLATD
ncbi:MAG: hypothetical protein IPN78_12725 [Candidatus Accumulibacter sp.]|nr:hypothetical protein [Candidatus Accumulibacter propinquus]